MRALDIAKQVAAKRAKDKSDRLAKIEAFKVVIDQNLQDFHGIDGFTKTGYKLSYQHTSILECKIDDVDQSCGRGPGIYIYVYTDKNRSRGQYVTEVEDFVQMLGVIMANHFEKVNDARQQ